MLGMHVRLGCPPGFDAAGRRARAARRCSAPATVRPVAPSRPRPSTVPIAVHTDTWMSMGQEAEKAAAAGGVRGAIRSTRR